jgi:hypothetical protein
MRKALSRLTVPKLTILHGLHCLWHRRLDVDQGPDRITSAVRCPPDGALCALVSASPRCAL